MSRTAYLYGWLPYLRLNGSLGSNCAPWHHFLLDTLALRYKMRQLMKEQTLSFQTRAGN